MENNNGLSVKVKKFFCYFVLIFLAVASLFPFYVLIVNATRAHADIQKGFSMIPAKAFIFNMKNVLGNENLPVLSGIKNSLIIATFSAGFSV